MRDYVHFQLPFKSLLGLRLTGFSRKLSLQPHEKNASFIQGQNPKNATRISLSLHLTYQRISNK